MAAGPDGLSFGNTDDSHHSIGAITDQAPLGETVNFHD